MAEGEVPGTGPGELYSGEPGFLLAGTQRRINDPEIIAACHCGAEYETKYSASIETHTATSIDCAHQKSTDIPGEESVDNSLEDWEKNYYNPTVATYNKHNMHTAEYDEDYEEERAA
ncbi:hypothetical protein F2Q69_00042523 [Brassica cretica]|uniref:Uncharacterized protein n=1 Tax=Brassica cretica TaxID=69181 RepID=A0A8S9N9C9_BRACR|nr:hypothetical protein F2Q69_00042523 [Brassica cretica]